MTVTLVLGGARSGKSRHAQALAEANGGELVYLATAEPIDAEMTERIARHRADRGPRWRLVEVPLDLPTTIAREAEAGRVLVVDCLTVWLANLMHHDLALDGMFDALDTSLAEAPAKIFLVSNEVGLGIVPGTPLGRLFRDEAGRLNARIAARATTVTLMVAGLPHQLKSG